MVFGIYGIYKGNGPYPVRELNIAGSYLACGLKEKTFSKYSPTGQENSPTLHGNLLISHDSFVSSTKFDLRWSAAATVAVAM